MKEEILSVFIFRSFCINFDTFASYFDRSEISFFLDEDRIVIKANRFGGNYPKN